MTPRWRRLLEIGLLLVLAGLAAWPTPCVWKHAGPARCQPRAGQIATWNGEGFEWRWP